MGIYWLLRRGTFGSDPPKSVTHTHCYTHRHPLTWGCAGEGVGQGVSPHQLRVTADLVLGPRGEETAMFIGHNQSKVTADPPTSSAPCFAGGAGAVSSTSPAALSARFHGRSPSDAARGSCPRTASSALPTALCWRFASRALLLEAKQLKHVRLIRHCCWLWGCKIYRLLYCRSPSSPCRELGLSLPFRVALHQNNIPYLRNTEPSTKHHVY